MIIWTGFGFLIPIIFILGLVGGVGLQTAIFGDVQNSGAENICIALGLTLSSITCWFFHKSLVKKGTETLLDKETGEEIVFEPSHSLYFIPMHWWGLIGAALSSFFFFDGIKGLLST